MPPETAGAEANCSDNFLYGDREFLQTTKKMQALEAESLLGGKVSTAYVEMLAWQLVFAWRVNTGFKPKWEI